MRKTSFLPGLSALRARVPVLAPAEKSALAILLALLASGALLRAWENSGVSLGPVDDWEGLRALVIRARAEDATPWPCLAPNGPGSFIEASGGSKKPARGKSKSGDDRKKPPPGILDLNKANEKQLNALPGVGPSTARAIVAWRTAQGGFASPEDLLNVKGIGPRKFEALRAWVKVSGPRKAAPAETSGKTAAPETAPAPDTISKASNALPAP